MRGKPAENTTISAAAIVVAVFSVLRAYNINMPPEVDALALLLVAAIPHAVTSFVNWRQKRDATGAVAQDVGQSHG